MEHRPYLHAAVAALAVAPLYLMHSFWFKRLMHGSSELAVTNLAQVILLIVFAIFVVGSAASVAVLAWYDGNRASVVTVALLFAAAPLAGGSEVGTEFFFLDTAFVPFTPSSAAFVLLGTEWSYRRRRVLSEFLRTRLGKSTAVVGMAHVAAGLYAQAGARPGFGFEFSILLFSIALLSAVLFSLVFVPVFLWYERHLYAPVVISAAWLLSGVWANYYLWESYPVSGIYPPGSVAPFAPAPDYAVKVVLPLMAVALVAVFEMIVRETEWGEIRLQEGLGSGGGQNRSESGEYKDGR